MRQRMTNKTAAVENTMRYMLIQILPKFMPSTLIPLKAVGRVSNGAAAKYPKGANKTMFITAGK